MGAVKNKIYQFILTGILLVLSMFNGMRLYQVNDIQAKESRGTILLAKSVEMLIEEKKNEKDFSFLCPGRLSR